MSQCRKTPKNNKCDNNLETVAHDKMPCAALSVCLGFGRELYFDGDCWSERGTVTLTDGYYNSFLVVNGCITAAEKIPAPSITAGPCAPVPADCGGNGGSGGSSDITVDTTAPCNIFYKGANGYTAIVNAESTDTVAVTGCGTAQQPFKFSANIPETSIAINSGTGESITVDKLVGQNVWVIKHADGLNQTINGMEFNASGHLVSYTAQEVSSITGITEGPGIKVDVTGGVAVVSLQPSDAKSGNSQLGGYLVETDLYGRIIKMDQTIKIEPVVLDPFFTELTINATGSVTEYKAIDRRPAWNFSKVFTGNRGTTTMVFTTGLNGSFRIKYLGDLGVTPTGVPATPTGLKSTIGAYQVLVDGSPVQAFMNLVGGRVAGLEAANATVHAAGQHTVELRAPSATDDYNFVDNGILDVTLNVLGA